MRGVDLVMHVVERGLAKHNISQYKETMQKSFTAMIQSFRNDVTAIPFRCHGMGQFGDAVGVINRLYKTEHFVGALFVDFFKTIVLNFRVQV